MESRFIVALYIRIEVEDFAPYPPPSRHNDHLEGSADENETSSVTIAMNSWCDFAQVGHFSRLCCCLCSGDTWSSYLFEYMYVQVHPESSVSRQDLCQLKGQLSVPPVCTAAGPGQSPPASTTIASTDFLNCYIEMSSHIILSPFLYILIFSKKYLRDFILLTNPI